MIKLPRVNIKKEKLVNLYLVFIFATILLFFIRISLSFFGYHKRISLKPINKNQTIAKNAVLGEAIAEYRWNFSNEDSYTVPNPEILTFDNDTLSQKKYDQTDNSETDFNNGKLVNLIWSNSKDGLLINSHIKSGAYYSKVFETSAEENWDEIEIKYSNPDVGPIVSKNTRFLDLNFDNNLKDESGKENNATAYNQTKLTNEGYSNKAIELDGNGDYLSLKNSLTDLNDGITVMAWVKTDSNGIVVSYDRSEIFRFGIGSSGSSGKVTWNTSSSEGINDMSGKSAVTDGKWHHIAGVYDSNRKEKLIYVDGKLDSKIKWGNGQIGKGITRYGFIGTGSEAVTENGTTGPNEWFKGVIDELKIYKEPLSGNEINDIYESKPGQIRLQVKSCNNPDCKDKHYTGPSGNSKSYYIFNKIGYDLTQKISLANITEAKYFQYFIEIIPGTNNNKPKLHSLTDSAPILHTLSIKPTHHNKQLTWLYTTDGPKYSKLLNLTVDLSEGSADSLGFQLSNNRENWYFYNGEKWIEVLSGSFSNKLSELNDNISTFNDDAGTGNLYIKIFINQKSKDFLKLNRITLSYIYDDNLEPTEIPETDESEQEIISDEEELKEVGNSEEEIASENSMPKVKKETIIKFYPADNQESLMSKTKDNEEAYETNKDQSSDKNSKKLKVLLSYEEPQNRETLIISGIAPNPSLVVASENENILDSSYTDKGGWKIEIKSIEDLISEGEKYIVLTSYDENMHIIEKIHMQITEKKETRYKNLDETLNLIDWSIISSGIVSILGAAAKLYSKFFRF